MSFDHFASKFGDRDGNELLRQKQHLWVRNVKRLAGGNRDSEWAKRAPLQQSIEVSVAHAIHSPPELTRLRFGCLDHFDLHDVFDAKPDDVTYRGQWFGRVWYANVDVVASDEDQARMGNVK
jgi:hypothetical protein